MTTNEPGRPKPSVFEDPENYPGITLMQPWAGLIWLAGAGYVGKELETRKMRISYRGNLVIGAGKRIDPDALSEARRRLVNSGLVPAAIFDKVCGKESAGKAMALFEVVGCRDMTAADHHLAFTDLTSEFSDPTGKSVWESGTIAALDPFDVKGAQGFFRVSREKVDKARTHYTTLEQRAEARTKRAATKCECGADFPMHLAEFMNNDPRSAHICRCHRKYIVTDMKFVADGTQFNPFSRSA